MAVCKGINSGIFPRVEGDFYGRQNAEAVELFKRTTVPYTVKDTPLRITPGPSGALFLPDPHTTNTWFPPTPKRLSSIAKHANSTRPSATELLRMLWLLPEELALHIILQLHPCTLVRLNFVSTHFLPPKTLQQGLVEQALRRLFRVGERKMSCVALYRLALHPDCRRVASGWCCIQTPPTIACGTNHTLIVNEQKQLLSCGSTDNRDGVIARSGVGHGVEDMIINVPTIIPGLTGVKILSVAAAGNHSLAASEAGWVYSWGAQWLGHGSGNVEYNRPDQGHDERLCMPMPVAALSSIHVCTVATSGAHSLVVSDSGDVYSWGYCNLGQLGHSDYASQSKPKHVKALPGCVCSVACGFCHSVAVLTTGLVYSWGWGGRGQLGHGANKSYPVPKLVEALPEPVRNVAAGGASSFAVSVNGRVYSWGSSEFGELGHEDMNEDRDGHADELLPRLVQVLLQECITAVVAGPMYSLALAADGAMYSWGFGMDGQLGRAEAAGSCLNWMPERVAIEGVCGMAAGQAHSLAVVRDGRTFGWGSGRTCALGLELDEDDNGDAVDQTTPWEYPTLRGLC